MFIGVKYENKSLFFRKKKTRKQKCIRMFHFWDCWNDPCFLEGMVCEQKLGVIILW